MIHVANSKIRKLNIKNINFQVQDCYSLDYDNKMFDVIIATNLMHLIEKPDQFLNSLQNLLKDHGKLILPTFLHNENLRTKFISKILKFKGHSVNTKFSSNSLIDLIEDCGYKIDKKVFIENIMPMLFVVVTK